MPKSTVAHARWMTAQEGTIRGRKQVRRRVAAVHQSQLIKYFTALGKHPQLPDDLAKARNFVCHPPVDSLQGAGENKSQFLADIAAYWLCNHYAPMWTVAPGMPINIVQRLLTHAVMHNWTWADIVASVTDLEQRPQKARVDVSVRLSTQTKDTGNESRGETHLFDDIDRTDNLGVGGPYIEATHRFYRGATLPEYLASARRAWKEANIKGRVSQATMNKKAGNKKQYAEHVDLYCQWYLYHCIQQQPTYKFIDAVTRGDISVKGWSQVPSVSAIEQRLRDARHWLTPRPDGEYGSLEMLLTCTTLESQTSLRLVTPNNSHYLPRFRTNG